MNIKVKQYVKLQKDAFRKYMQGCWWDNCMGMHNKSWVVAVQGQFDIFDHTLF